MTPKGKHMDNRVIRVKSTHPKSQGDYVQISAHDFDASKHELYFDSDPVDVNTMAFAAERDIAVKHGKEISKEARKEADTIYDQQQKDLEAARKKQADDEQSAKDREALRLANTPNPVDPGDYGDKDKKASEIVTPPTPGGAIPPNKVLNPNTGEETTKAAAAAAWDTGKGRKQ